MTYNLQPLNGSSFPLQMSGVVGRVSVTLSHSEQLIAILTDETLLEVHSLNSQSQLLNYQSSGILGISFFADDTYLIINMGSYLKNYSLVTSSWNNDNFFNSQENNQFSGIVTSINNKHLYVLNHSTLINLNLFLNQITNLPVQDSQCTGQIFIDRQSGLFLTASYNCLICSFNLASDLTLLQQIQIPECRLGQLVILQEQIIITQDSIMTQFPTIITLDAVTLKMVGNQSMSVKFPLSIELYNNYLMVFSYLGSQIQLYRNNLNTFVTSIDMSPIKIMASVFSPLNNQLHILKQLPFSQQWNIQSFQLFNNCLNSSCSCTQGMVFQMSSGSCVSLPCTSANQICTCSRHQMFDSFSLSCQMECGSIFGSIPSLPFGRPQSCYCSPPLGWNSEVKDCSKLDCSLIPNTQVNTNTIRSACLCQSGYIWNSINNTCFSEQSEQNQQTTASGAPVALIITLIIVLIVIIVLAIIFFYRRIRKNIQSLQQPHIPYKMKEVLQQLPTQRYLDPQHNLRTEPQNNQAEE